MVTDDSPVTSLTLPLNLMRAILDILKKRDVPLTYGEAKKIPDRDIADQWQIGPASCAAWVEFKRRVDDPAEALSPDEMWRVTRILALRSKIANAETSIRRARIELAELGALEDA